MFCFCILFGLVLNYMRGRTRLSSDTLIGVFLAILSAVANFFFIPYYPVWSVLIIALNIAIIWALVVYGPEQAEGM